MPALKTIQISRKFYTQTNKHRIQSKPKAFSHSPHAQFAPISTTTQTPYKAAQCFIGFQWGRKVVSDRTLDPL